MGEERLLQDVVDEVLAQGVWITRVRRLRGQGLVETRHSIRLAVAGALSRKECEWAVGAIKAAVTKVLVKRKWVRLLAPRADLELSASYLCVILSFYSLNPILSHVRVECYNISIKVMHTCGKAYISWVGAKLLVGVQVACLRIGSMDRLRTA